MPWLIRSHHAHRRLRNPNAIGWRGVVSQKRAGGQQLQVQVFGVWFALYDDDGHLMPIGAEDEASDVADHSDDSSDLPIGYL
tara:strand:+ start:506 stop:751 length:246 start_codon:yes stop_codon:yes gene_type:complete